jgi:hypothetical protein
MATATARTVGKTEFVKEVLGKNPHANPTAVNEEWKSAGQDGTISATLVNKLRSSMGLAGNLRPTPKTKTRSRSVEKRPPSGKKRGGKAQEQFERDRTAGPFPLQRQKERSSGDAK